jgi:hypothetical protein
MKERDTFSREPFGREPTRERVQWFGKMDPLMNIKPNDTMWHVILVNELYRDRLNRRLAEIGRVADNAEEKILTGISEVVYVTEASKPADEIEDRQLGLDFVKTKRKMSDFIRQAS